jgi:diguanylate cyclase (GGDEF)-like protein/PAS domain S-box-containing protein
MRPLNTQRIRLLLVEDSPDDARLILRELRMAGLAVSERRVETEPAFRAALEEGGWDIIVTDYLLPEFSGLKVLEIIQQNWLDIPVIVLSGKAGEELAVAVMKAGAQDYLVKENLARLVPAVMRELAEGRRARRAASVALHESQELFRRIVETTAEGILTTSPAQDVVFVNHRLARMLGCVADDLSGRNLQDLIDKGIIPAIHNPSNLTPADRERYDLSFFRSDSVELWFSVSSSPLTDYHGRALGTLTMFSDITERKRIEQQLMHEALHDSLSSLPNRALFLDRVAHCLARRERAPGLAAVLFLDLDRFKNVNDSLGHFAGDRLLAEVGSRLQKCVRTGDTVARYGGDEFTVLLESLTSEDQSLEVAARIKKELGYPILLDGCEIFVTASIGIVHANGRYVKAEDLLRDADTAMYRAKAAGRATAVLFHPAMRAGVAGRLQMEANLRRAIEQRDFLVHYQPIVCLESGRIAAVEALVRWQHPVRGLMLPDEFLPVAAEAGLTASIGYLVLEEASRHVARWKVEQPGCRDLHLYVNVSAAQIEDRQLPDRIQKILASAGLDPSSLEIEVTEEIITEMDLIHETLTALRALGIGVLMDDFGTGYSSLNRITQVPASGIKIAGSFLKRGSENSEVVRTILSLARNLNLTVIAEGVETEQHAEKLSELGCNFGQGFYFSPPVPAGSVSMMLSAGRLFR